jgi:hypothetical protein
MCDFCAKNGLYDTKRPVFLVVTWKDKKQNEMTYLKSI